MVGLNVNNAYSSYAAQTALSKKTEAAKTEAESKVKETGKSDYGKTIGEPKLSETAQKYYEQLKKKYGNYDFILVSRDEKANAQANASKYANGLKTVVLIDEDKIEKMATDENYRKQYENVLSGAQAKLDQLKEGMESAGANVKGYGMQVNDNGTVSYFAVLKKSSEAQKARIEKKAEAKKEEKRAESRKERKAASEKSLSKSKEKNIKEASEETDDSELLTADSLEDLLNKISDFIFIERSNNVQTESELQVGQNIDFRG